MVRGGKNGKKKQVMGGAEWGRIPAFLVPRKAGKKVGPAKKKKKGAWAHGQPGATRALHPKKSPGNKGERKAWPRQGGSKSEGARETEGGGGDNRGGQGPKPLARSQNSSLEKKRERKKEKFSERMEKPPLRNREGGTHY